MRVLLVGGDDESTAKVVTNSLTQQNYAVDVATDDKLGWQFVETIEYSLILLDVVLPKLDGISFCQRLRQEHYQMPVLLLTTQNTITDKIRGLDAGADDYVVKPFELRELMARIRALLRRGTSLLPPVMQWGSLRLDPSICEVTYDGKPLSLTPKEYSLLKFFLHNCDRIVSRGTILDHLWTFENPPEEDTIKSHIKSLRRKFKSVETSADPIETVYGLGYRLKPSSKERNQTMPSTNLEEGSKQQVMMAVTQPWESYSTEIYSYMSMLEQAITALGKEPFNNELQLKVQRQAYKLADSLNSSGITRGSQLSSEIEALLKAKSPLGITQAQRLSELVTTLRCELGKTVNRRAFKPILDDTRLPAKLRDQDETVQALEQALYLANRHGQPLYLVILKLDNIRLIRYQHGDVVEDVVMCQLKQFLRQMFRSTDIVARWNDGMCVVGLYGMSKFDGARRLREIVKLLHQKNFVDSKGNKLQMILRVGTAGYPDDGTDWQILYQTACATLINRATIST